MSSKLFDLFQLAVIKRSIVNHPSISFLFVRKFSDTEIFLVKAVSWRNEIKGSLQQNVPLPWMLFVFLGKILSGKSENTIPCCRYFSMTFIPACYVEC